MSFKWIRVLMLGILFAGCTNDNEQTVREDVITDETPFVSTLEQRISRTYVKDGKYLRWNKDDRISMFRGSTMNLQYRFDGETGDNSGMFYMVDFSFDTGIALDHHYAVYPYNKDFKISEKGVISLTLPSLQNYAENSFGIGSNAMVAITKDLSDTHLNFRNINGCLRLQFYGHDITVKSILLRGYAHEKIAGSAHVYSEYGKIPTLQMAEGATESILLDCGESGVTLSESADEPTTFWIVLPPVVFSKGFTATLTNDKDEEMVVSTTQSVTFERNVVRPMAVLELKNFGDSAGKVGVLKEEAPMTDDETVYVIGGGKVEIQKND